MDGLLFLTAFGIGCFVLGVIVAAVAIAVTLTRIC